MGQRRVIKVGTSVLRGLEGRSTAAVIADLAASLSGLWQRGEPVALVTSGAVGLGCQALGLLERPRELEALQAAAAVGQGRLMGLYDQSFASHGRSVAQVLLTRGDLASRRRYQNARRTLDQLLAWGVTPVVNENDTLATDELRFGDNDTLSALVAVAIGADELVLLTDVDALYSGDPRSDTDARPIAEVASLAELERLGSAATGGGRWGTGGMTTKLAAARIATHWPGAHWAAISAPGDSFADLPLSVTDAIGNPQAFDDADAISSARASAPARAPNASSVRRARSLS
jgi:glutamate 5-kinase